MAVNTPGKDYAAQAEEWAKIRALSNGVAAVRSYIEPLPGMATDRATAFQKRAYYLPALPRTVEMFSGLIFLRDPLLTAGDAVKTKLAKYLEDATLTGLSFFGLCSQVVSQQIEVGRVAVLVDYPKAVAGLTVAQAEKAGLRASARPYLTESILATEYGNFGGARKLSRVRLKETATITDPETFDEVEVERVRILELAGGLYQQRVMEKQEGGAWVEIESFQPLRSGAALDYIPIFFFNARDQDPTATRPPLADLADVSISHLNTSALSEWGEMWTANPTPWARGIQAAPVDEHGQTADANKFAINLGSSEMILVTENGELGMLEFTGAGLERLAATMDRKEKHMAALGTRALLDDPRQAIAAETAKIQRAGENSTLGKISSVASAGMTLVLREIALWAGETAVEKISVALNRNFFPAGITPEELKAALLAVQAGEMSSREFFDLLKSRDAIDPAKEWEAHLFEIEEDSSRIAERDGPPEDEPPAAGA